MEDIETEVAESKTTGAVFEEYDSARLRTVDGIATTRAGRGAWLRDNESNILGLVEPAARNVAIPAAP